MEMFIEGLPVLVNFIAMVGILVWATRKPAGAFLVKRSHHIEAELLEAESLSSEARTALSRWEMNWKNIEAHSKSMFDDAKGTIERFRASSLSKTKHEAERLKHEAVLVSKSEMLKAKQELQRELAKRSLTLVQQYLGSHLNEEDRHRLVTDYVEIVGNGSSR